MEEADREIIDDMQRWLKLEIEYWEEKLPETCITQKELEEGLEREEIEAAIGGQGERQGELIPWHGTQEDFTRWLARSYEEWIGKYYGGGSKKFPFSAVADKVAPLFRRIEDGEPMNPKTVAKKKSQVT